MKKLTRPYFRVTIHGFYKPEDKTSGLKGVFYIKQQSIIGNLICWLAPFVVKKESL